MELRVTAKSRVERRLQEIAAARRDERKKSFDAESVAILNDAHAHLFSEECCETTRTEAQLFGECSRRETRIVVECVHGGDDDRLGIVFSDSG